MGGAGAVSDSFAPFWDPFPPTRLLRLTYMSYVPSSVDIFRRPVLF